MKTEKIQKILNKICTADFICSDVGLLFIWLRPSFSNDQILLDLSNFVAHSESRDRGVSFNHVNSFVMNFISVSEKGGTIFGRSAVFNKTDVIQRLITVLQTLGLIFENNKLFSQRDKLADCLQELIEETEFRFADPRIIRCYVKRSGRGMQFCLEADLKGPAIKMTPGASVCSDLFD
ncbi:MAG: hypothetical protein NTY11_02075 [Candidatus Parcubacteria bacterium]|nr:hypothetical protein [Candidatus Parcubacteria bacterium]